MDSDHSRLQDYVILKTLGKGSTAKVKLARDIRDNELVAIKIIKPQKLSHLATELNVLKKVPSHPNITKLITYSNSSIYQKKSGEQKIVSYMVLEFYSKGEIFDYIYKLGPFPECIARRCSIELVLGIEALHQSGVVHRDLKPENIFFSDKFELKLADFGFCAPASGRDGSGLLQSFKGTRSYMAPEILEQRPYRGVLTDIFSAGIIIFLFTFGRPPFARADRMNPHYINIINGNWERFWRIHNVSGSPTISDSLKDLIQKMLAYNPEERITLNEIKNHQWIKGRVATQEETEGFLAKANENVAEIVPNNHTQTEEIKGYRSAAGNDISLSRNSSRLPVEIEGSSFKSTKFVIETHPDLLFEEIKGYFKQKGTIKLNLYSYSIKATLDQLEIRVEIISFDDKYIVEVSKLCGDHWEFYEAYEDFYQSLKHL